MSFPVADAVTVRRYVRGLIRTEKALLGRTTFWFVMATACGLAVPALVGSIVDAISRGAATTTRLNLTVVAIVCLLLLQGLLIRHARFLGARLGEKVLAGIREEFSQLPRSKPRPSCQRHRDDILPISTQTDQERATPEIGPAHHHGKPTQRCHLIVLQTPSRLQPAHVGGELACAVRGGRRPLPQPGVLPHGHSNQARRARLDQLPSRPA
jgi:hypothetical protein